MWRTAFFLDSGIIYGQFDSKDDYHRGSLNHLSKYPYKDHNYYAVKRCALLEVRSIQKNKRSRPGNNNYRGAARLKTAQMKESVEGLFLFNKVKDIDYKGVHASFDELYNILFDFLELNKKDNNSKDRDAYILTNAFIWDKEVSGLHNPRLVTIDRCDFVLNKDGLKCKANDCLKNTTQMDFCLILARKHAS